MKDVCVKGTWSWLESIDFLINLGATSTEQIKVGGVEVVPRNLIVALLENLTPDRARPVDCACTRVAVRGEEAGEKVEYTGYMVNRPYRDWTISQHRLGHATSIGARMVIKGEIRRRGVFPSEMVIEPNPFFKQLARRELEASYSIKYYI